MFARLIGLIAIYALLAHQAIAQAPPSTSPGYGQGGAGSFSNNSLQARPEGVQQYGQQAAQGIQQYGQQAPQQAQQYNQQLGQQVSQQAQQLRQQGAAQGQNLQNGANNWRNPAPGALLGPPDDNIPRMAQNPRGPQPGIAPIGAVPPTNPGSSGQTDPNGMIEPLRTINKSPRKPLARVISGPATLPNEQGQVWREYDISPYTVRVTSTNKPEQAIVDWILRETGYEAWHSEPLGILCATPRTLKVYHTPEMHAVVSEVVDRFVSSEAESNSFGLRVISIDSPSWRAKAHAMLKPVPVQTQGVQAWIMPKEDAALLIADLRKRTDYQEHNSPLLMMNNGQATTVTVTRPITYVRDVQARPQAWPQMDTDYAQFEEGYSVELHPLMALDGRTVDAVLKCHIDQLERMFNVPIDVVGANNQHLRSKLDVPQFSHLRMHERFRWPVDQVLLVGLGIVASPTPSDTHPLVKNVPVLNAPDRGDLLVFIESKGKIAAGSVPLPPPPGTQPPPPPTGDRTAVKPYRGRY